MEEAVDGEYQVFKSRDGAYVPQPLLRQVSRAARDGRQHVRRRTIWALNRGGHDPHKMYAAYAAAVNTRTADRDSRHDHQG
jgi:pyruvate dehydrogenase E1 component